MGPTWANLGQLGSTLGQLGANLGSRQGKAGLDSPKLSQEKQVVATFFDFFMWPILQNIAKTCVFLGFFEVFKHWRFLSTSPWQTVKPSKNILLGSPWSLENPPSGGPGRVQASRNRARIDRNSQPERPGTPRAAKSSQSRPDRASQGEPGCTPVQRWCRSSQPG